MTRLKRSAFKHIERYLYNYEDLKKEIEGIKRLIESEDLEPIERGLLISLGVEPIKRTKTDEDLEFVNSVLSSETMTGYEYDVPCHNHIANASVCSVYGLHMSKCPLLNEKANGCPSLDSGIPTINIFEERFSQHLNYYHSQIVSEVEDYLNSSEVPPSSLIKAIMDIKTDFKHGSSDNYKNVLLGKNKIKKERKPISTRTRFEVLKKSDFKCVYCGIKSMDSSLHIDHVIPVAKGGTNDIENLVAACQDCNLGKSDISL